MRSLRPESAAFTLLLGALVTLASFATDMGLPVFHATAASVGVLTAAGACGDVRFALVSTQHQ